MYVYVYAYVYVDVYSYRRRGVRGLRSWIMLEGHMSRSSSVPISIT